MAKAQYPLNITTTDNGFIVTAGCMTLVFDDADKLFFELALWIRSPAEQEKKYLAKYRNEGPHGEVLRAEMGYASPAAPPTSSYPTNIAGLAGAGQYIPGNGPC